MNPTGIAAMPPAAVALRAVDLPWAETDCPVAASGSEEQSGKSHRFVFGRCVLGCKYAYISGESTIGVLWSLRPWARNSALEIERKRIMAKMREDAIWSGRWWVSSVCLFEYGFVLYINRVQMQYNEELLLVVESSLRLASTDDIGIMALIIFMLTLFTLHYL